MGLASANTGGKENRGLLSCVWERIVMRNEERRASVRQEIREKCNWYSSFLTGTEGEAMSAWSVVQQKLDVPDAILDKTHSLLCVNTLAITKATALFFNDFYRGSLTKLAGTPLKLNWQVPPIWSCPCCQVECQAAKQPVFWNKTDWNNTLPMSSIWGNLNQYVDSSILVVTKHPNDGLSKEAIHCFGLFPRS